MEQIVTIYQGNDPREKERINEALKNASISFYDSLYLGLALELDPQEPVSNRARLLLTPIRWGGYRSAFYENLCQKKGYRPQGFEIKTLEKDEGNARKILAGLDLSRELAIKNPSTADKFNAVIQKAALPTGIFLVFLTALLMIGFVTLRLLG